jgi:ketosteroid isomerase-like protein
MTTTVPDTTAGDHAFTAALAARDIDALVATLAPEAVLYSAITNTPFEGREVLADIYSSLFEGFEELRVTDRFQGGDTHVFFWEGRIDGRFVAGADRFRVDDAGQVREITIVGRPLTGLAGFITGLGFHFARRRRGRVVATILRVTALPLAPLFSLMDRIVGWLIRGRSDR